VFAVIHTPRFHLAALARHVRLDLQSSIVALMNASADAPKKLRQKALMLHASGAAAAMGARPGMTATQLQTRCTAVDIRYRHTDAELALQRDLLDLAERHTPDFENTEVGAVTLDLQRRYGLPTDMERWATELQQKAQTELGVTVCIGVGRSPDVALLAASLQEPVVILPGSAEQVRQSISGLPLHEAGQWPEIVRLADLWGLRSMGDLGRLSRAELVQRLGTDAGRCWDLARGESQRLLRLVRPVQDYTLEESFSDHELERSDVLLVLVARMLQTLLARVQSAWKVVGGVRIHLSLADGSAHELDLRPAEPSSDPALIERLARTAVEAYVANAPIRAVSVELWPARAVSGQRHLFEHSLKDPNKFAETLGQLETLLGQGRVGVPVSLQSHLPDALKVVSFTTELSAAEHAELPLELEAHPMPVKRLRPALAAQVTTTKSGPCTVQADGYRAAIKACRGPWRSSGEWWDAQSWAYEEWDVCLMDDRLIRLRQDAGTGDWWVDGVYG
jgi:protein ImuB